MSSITTQKSGQGINLLPSGKSCFDSVPSIWIAEFVGVFFWRCRMVIPDCSSLKWFDSPMSLCWHQELICFVVLCSCSESCLFISFSAARNLFSFTLCKGVCVCICCWRFKLLLTKLNQFQDWANSEKRKLNAQCRLSFYLKIQHPLRLHIALGYMVYTWQMQFDSRNQILN